MKVLFIGGNGNISWWCVNESLKKGYDVTILNRQETVKTRREVQAGVKQIKADIRNLEETQNVLADCEFDVVCDFLVRNKYDADRAYQLFKDKTKQYIFISSECVYRRDGKLLPLKENAPLFNPDHISSEYVKGKILAEIAFRNYYEKNGFPVTIVRPSYTYDTIIPSSIGHNCFTTIKYALEHKTLFIGGDGYALRTFTHSTDFAKAFNVLVGNSATIGEDYHIATDDWLTWNEATSIIVDIFEIDKPKIFHLSPSFVLNSHFGSQCELALQKMYHLIYDCSKIKSIAKGWYAEKTLPIGLTETKNWLEENQHHKRVDDKLYQALDNLITMKENDNMNRVCPVCRHSKNDVMFELCQNTAVLGGGLFAHEKL